MKLFEIKLREGEEHFTTSLVKDPAIESTLLFFNKEEEKPTFFLNEEKRIIYSVAMRPNKKIFRKDVNGEPAYVFYTEETVEKFQEKYFKFQGQGLTNLNHSENYLKDVFLIESWVVKDKNNDKSNVIGLDTLDGDLVQAFKIENDAVWEDCKLGKIDGLSIEAYFDNFEINKNEEKMSKQTIWNSITEAIKKFAGENNSMTIEIDGKKYNVTALEEGGLVTDENGEPLVEGTFEVDGVTYKTDTVGAILKPEEMAVEPDKEEEMAEDVPTVESLQAEIEILKTDKINLEKELADCKAEKVAAETNLQTMKTQTPKATVISRNPVIMQKEYKDMTNFEKVQFNRGKI